MAPELHLATSSEAALAQRVAELEKKLAAKERTIAVLAARVESRLHQEGTPFAVLQSNVGLEQIVKNKTRELERTMTELKRAQAELVHTSKLTAIGQLAAGIAHEINTPIQYINDNTHFLQRAINRLVEVFALARRLRDEVELDERGRALFATMEVEIARLRIDYLLAEAPRAIEQALEGLARVSSIVGAMKEFSHPSGGTKAPVNLANCITSTVTVARNTWKYVAELETDLDPTLPDVPGLRDELAQAILNLVVNAADAISDVVEGGAKGKGRIVIRTRRAGDHVEIHVSDTGTGIPEAIRSRVFDPFFTTKKVGRGTGQGLAMVYSIVVDKHGGTVSFDSEVGAGTTFVVRLPLVEPAP